MAAAIMAGGRYATRGEYVAEDRIIRAAMQELEDTMPNLRDYWPNMERWDIARTAHEDKGRALRDQREALLKDFNAHTQFV